MLKGSIDLIDHQELRGWAQDEAAPGNAVSLVIFDNEKEIGRARAQLFRGDLLEAGIGDGHHAFEFKFAGALSPHVNHAINVRAENGSDLPGSPVLLKAVAPAEAPGSLDHADRHTVAGWCQDAGRSDTPVSLIITDNDRLLGRVLANLHRPDLVAAGIGSGRHAFDFHFPRALSPAEKHVIRVQRELDGVDLPGSPVTIEPASEFDPEAQASLSKFLSHFSREDDLERKIMFLAGELNELTQRRADTESHRWERRRNRDLMRRWGASQPAGPDGGEAKKELLRALIIDDRLPALDRDAGSNAIVSHIRSLQRLGYDVSLVPTSDLSPDDKTCAALRSAQVSVCALPFYGSTEEVLWRQAGEFDLVYLHRISNAAKYGELVRQHFPKARKIYSVADLHHIRLSRQAAVESRSELLKVAERVKFSEFLAAATADVVITHSDYEAEVLRKNLPKANVHRVPWAVSARPTNVPFAERSGVAFIGGYGHAPNVDAAKWLMNSLMPRVRWQDPGIECLLVGSALPDELRNVKVEGVTLVGHVDDLSTIFDRVRLTVAPLSYGAGIKGKILDSLAAGIPCVYTTLAAEGMNLPAELEPCRADNARTIASAICDLHANAELYDRCREAGLKYVADELSEEKIDLAMRRAIQG
jgi:glycosyltransferase involved in cell wall biosynthesis